MSTLDQELNDILADLPEFQTDGDSIEIFKTPAQFHENLLKSIRNAKRRIILCSLYLGDDGLSRKLMDEIWSVLEREPDLQVKMLFDYNRSTRKNDNCLKIFQNLIKNFGEKRVQIAFFHTPLLRDWRKNFVPRRWNEIFGVQHMKLYIFDDDLLISGANLSETYFTNRQDRYFFLKSCQLLTDFYQQIVDVFCQFSFKFGKSKNGDLQILENAAVHPFQGDFTFFTSRLKKKVCQILQNYKNSPIEMDKDTKISPVIQMGACGLEDESRLLEKLFDIKSKVDWRIASGYFNLTEKYQYLLLQNFDQNRVSILTASPSANGFHNARGISFYVPALYTHILKSFFNRFKHLNNCKVELFEFQQPKMSFHAKGLWLEDGWSSSYYSTMIGSTNYGHRSNYLDLETQLFIRTKNLKLKNKLREEEEYLWQNASKVETVTFLQPDHFVPFWIRILSKYIKNFF